MSFPTAQQGLIAAGGLVAGIFLTTIFAGEAKPPVQTPELDNALAAYIASSATQAHITKANACGGDINIEADKSATGIEINIDVATGNDTNGYRMCMSGSADSVGEAVADYMSDPEVKTHIQRLTGCGADVEIKGTRSGSDVTIKIETNTPAEFEACMHQQFVQDMLRNNQQVVVPDLDIAPE